jgi:uncharacterized protein (DUF58 family)
MTASVPVELVPRRRGMHALGRYQLSTSFPFGFIKRAVERDDPDTLLVYPAIGMVDQRLLQLCRSAENIGPSVRPRRGGTDEFFGLKDYRQGESPRFIYWRRSARTGTLVTREMTHVSPPRLTIVLDTFIPDRTPAHHADVEMCIAMTASLASSALEADVPVGLIVWSEALRRIDPQRGKRHRRDLLTLLAQLPMNRGMDCDALLTGAFDALDGVATPVLITPSTTEPRGGMLTIRPHTPQAGRWFTFDPQIDFAHAMPMDQQLPRSITPVEKLASATGD